MKKEIIIPLVVILAGIAFTALAFLVWFSRGRIPVWVKYKLRIGALILTLTATVSGGCHRVINCYVPEYSETASVRDLNSRSGKIEVESIERKNKPAVITMNNKDSLDGRMMNYFGADFSYRIVNKDGIEVIKNNLAFIKTKQGNDKKFKIGLNGLANGNYDLFFYNTPKDNIQPEIFEKQFLLRIHN
jgi:hypothetical protein